MTIKEHFEKQEAESFDILVWLERLNAAKDARSQWDTDYETAAAILSNKVAIADSKNSLDKFTDKMFHTNWLLKLCIWLESYIMSADVYAELKSHAGADDRYPDRLTLEMELNRLLARFEMARDWGTGVVPSRIRYGYGVSYAGWNRYRRDGYWRNGMPAFGSQDPRRVWVDPGANGINFKDRKWVFCKVEVSVDDAKMMFPDFADEISELRATEDEGDAPLRKDRFDYYICQYQKMKRDRMIDIEVLLDQKTEIKQVLLSQVQEFEDSNPGKEWPDNMRIIDEGDDMPGYDSEVNTVYQFMFSPEFPDRPLTMPEYIGDQDQFQFWCHHRIDDDIYPRGTAYMLSDEQTIKSILLTKAAVEAIRNGRGIPFLEQGAIADEDEFATDHNSFDYVGIIDQEWRESHPGQKPIEYVTPEFNPQVTAFLNQLIKEEMQEFSGGTDAMMGKAQYSGMSAAQTGMLQASGATYTKADELSYRDYVKDVMDCYLKQLAEYVSYEHTIDGVQEDGRSQTMTINFGGVPDWDWERYYVVPIIENSPEMVKQLKEQRAMQLKSMGAMSTVRMLQELGYNDAERIAQEALAEMNILAAVQKLQENPELLQAILSAPSEETKETKKASNA